MNHTPTPWTLHQNTEEGIHILSSNDVIVCEHIADGETAKTMLRACNSHQALVEALEFVSKFEAMQKTKGRDIFPAQLSSAISTALASA